MTTDPRQGKMENLGSAPASTNPQTFNSKKSMHNVLQTCGLGVSSKAGRLGCHIRTSG